MDRDSHTPCPFVTTSRSTPEELQLGQNAEVRAFKLGRKRHCYNRVDLQLCNRHSGEVISLTEAKVKRDELLHHPESSIAYNLKLSNLAEAKLQVYVVYDGALEVKQPPGVVHRQEGRPVQQYEWFCVERNACRKESEKGPCQGPVLVPMKRFGAKCTASNREDAKKTPSSLHLSIDEASTHVGVRCFRLVFGVFAKDTTTLIGTGCSRPIRVLVNNDAPGGPATLDVTIDCDADWSGWGMAVYPAPRLLQAEHIHGALRPPTHRHHLLHPAPVKPPTPPPSAKKRPRPDSPEETAHPAVRPCLGHPTHQGAASSAVLRPFAVRGAAAATVAQDSFRGLHGLAVPGGAASQEEDTSAMSSNDAAEEHMFPAASQAVTSDGPATPDQPERADTPTGDRVPCRQEAFYGSPHAAAPRQALQSDDLRSLPAHELKTEPKSEDAPVAEATRAVDQIHHGDQLQNSCGLDRRHPHFSRLHAAYQNQEAAARTAALLQHLYQSRQIAHNSVKEEAYHSVLPSHVEGSGGRATYSSRFPAVQAGWPYPGTQIPGSAAQGIVMPPKYGSSLLHQHAPHFRKWQA